MGYSKPDMGQSNPGMGQSRPGMVLLYGQTMWSIANQVWGYIYSVYPERVFLPSVQLAVKK